MIEKLTKKQIDQLEIYKNKWLEIGLDTKRANRSTAEQAAKDVYRKAKLEEPKIFIWVDSPISGLIAAKLVKEISKKYSTFDANQVGAQVWAQVWDQVRDQVWAQVGDQVGAQVWDQVWAQVGDQVGAQVWAQVWDQVRDQVWAQVGDQVRDQVWAQVGDQVGAQVGAQVWAQVWDQVRDQVWAQVGDQVGAQVWDQVRAQVRDQVVDTKLIEESNDVYFRGSQDAGWLSLYSYFLDVCNLKCCKRLQPLMTLAQETGWVWFYKNVVIFSEKPTEINRNERHQLHNFDRASLTYADGYSLYAVHGLRVPEYIIKTKANEFTKDVILKEQNTDYRRAIIQKIGIVKAIEILGAEVIDTYESTVGGKYELLSIDYDGRGNKRPFLKMQNPSIGEYHIEGCLPNIKTVKEALCYRNGLKEFSDPEEMT